MNISMRMVLEQFKEFKNIVLRHNKLTSLVPHSFTEAGIQSAGMAGAKQKGDCRINNKELGEDYSEHRIDPSLIPLGGTVEAEGKLQCKQ
jgi:hypothetical protein